MEVEVCDAVPTCLQINTVWNVPSQPLHVVSAEPHEVSGLIWKIIGATKSSGLFRLLYVELSKSLHSWEEMQIERHWLKTQVSRVGVLHTSNLSRGRDRRINSRPLWATGGHPVLNQAKEQNQMNGFY